MDIAEYARQHNATIRLADFQKGMGWHTDDDGWMHFQQRVTVKMGNRQMTLEWRQGSAHGTDLPTVDSVLGALISEGMTVESCQGLDDFMAEYGYEDRRKAQKIWKALEAQYPKIVNLFGGKEKWDYVTETISY